MKLRFFFVTIDKKVTLKYGTIFNKYFNKIIVLLEYDTETGQFKIVGVTDYDPALVELLLYYGYRDITPIIEKIYGVDRKPRPLDLLEIDLSKIRFPIDIKKLTK